MSFNTVSATFPTLTATADRLIFNGHTKWALSMWIRWPGRSSDTNHVFGAFESDAAGRVPFYVSHNSGNRSQMTLTVDNAGTKASIVLVAGVLTAMNTTGWYHVLYTYDASLASGHLKAYINGVLDGSANAPAGGLPIWTRPAGTGLGLGNIPLRWRPIAATSYDFGEMAIFSGAAIPSVAEFQAYAAGGTIEEMSVAPVLRWENATETGTETVAPSGGDRTTVPEIAGAATFTVTTGSGTLTTEVAGSTPAYEIISGGLTLLRGGTVIEIATQAIGTESTDYTITSMPNRPTVRVQRNGAGAFEGAYATAALFGIKTNYGSGGKVLLAVPAALLPIGADDVVQVTFPEQAFLVGNLTQYTSAASQLAVVNASTAYRYTLPETRIPIGVNCPWAANYILPPIHNNIFLIAAYTADPSTFTVNDKGIPITAPAGSFVQYVIAFAAEAGPSPMLDTGRLHILYREINTGANLVFPGATELNVADYGLGATVTIGGVVYKHRMFLTDASESGLLIVQVNDVGGGATNLTDFMAVMGQDWTRFAAGNNVNEYFSDRFSGYSYLRWMDTMRANNSPVVLPAHLASAGMQRLEDIVNVSTLAACADATSDYFGTGNTVLKLTFAADHGFYTGQKLVLSSWTGAWWRTVGNVTFTGGSSVGAYAAGAYGGGLFATASAVQLETDGTLPAAVTARTTYYFRNRGSGAFSLHPTALDATNDTNAITMATTGSGTHTIHESKALPSLGLDLYNEDVSLDTDEILAFIKYPGYVQTGTATAKVTVRPLYPLEHIAAVHNEIYTRTAGVCDTCWICLPHAATDATYTEIVTRLHAALNPAIELMVEYSNETWNTGDAFSGQQRYVTNQARLAGITAHAWHGAKVYAIHELVRPLVGERSFSVYCAGQSVNTSVLSERIAAFQAAYEADANPAKPETWADVSVKIGVANYSDFADMTTQGERDFLLAGGPECIAYMCMMYLRPGLAGYGTLQATYAKPFWAYEGSIYDQDWGTAWTLDPNATALQRIYFAGNLHPNMIDAIRGTSIYHQETCGFDTLCVSANTGRWSTTGPATHSIFNGYKQVSGVGDGSDGKYDNTANMDTYIAVGADGEGSTFSTDWVSPKGYAIAEWTGTLDPDTPAPTASSTTVIFCGSGLGLGLGFD